jgi:hypothetical protein
MRGGGEGHSLPRFPASPPLPTFEESPHQRQATVAQPDRPAESKPLSRELSVFLIQLSVGLHKYGTYPKGHPVIEHAASAVYNGLSTLLAQRDGLALGVARDQLIVEGAATDTDNAVLRELAHRLHRHQIGVIKFRKEIAPEELLEFLQTVSAEANRQEMPFGLRPPEEIERWPNIEIVPFTFEHLQIGESGGEQAVQGRSSQLWLGLAAAALRKGRSSDVVEQDPDQIATAINSHRQDKAYDQIIVGYLQELGRELRMREGESYAQLQTRVSQLLSSLDQETVTRLLTVGGDLATRTTFVADFASSLPVKAVLDLVQAAAAAQHQTISHSLLRMLTKLADHADQGQTTVRANADETFRNAVNDLLHDWTLDDPNPDNYTMVLDQLSLPSEAGAEARSETEHLSEAPRILQMALELDVIGEAVWTSLARIVEEGRLDELVTSLDGAPADSIAAETIWVKLAEPELMSGILEHGDAHLDAVERILDKVGLFAIGPMLDALAITESRTMRHRLLNAITALGAPVGPPALARLVGAEWFVQRNLLIVLGALPEWPANFIPETYATGDDARVRREAIKLMLQGTQRPDLRPQGVVLSLGDDDDAVMRMGLAAALEGCPPAAEPLLAKLLEHNEEEVRVLAVRVFATLRSRRARDLLLLQVLAKKKWWRRTRLNQPSPEMLAALRGLANSWARHPDAQVVMDLAARSPLQEIRSAAGLA